MLFTVPSGMLPSLDGRTLSDALEMGRIVLFPECPVELPPPQDLELLRRESSALLPSTSIRFHPEAGRLTGIPAKAAAAGRIKDILGAHAARVQAFLAEAMPEFLHGSRAGASCVRPIQERGQRLKPHASDERIHVDGGDDGPTRGDRILRFLVNVDPAEDRVWASRGTFAELYEKYGEAAGLGPGRRALEEGLWDRVRTGLAGAAAKRGLAMARALDTSPYDRAMRRFHNFMKGSPAFLESREGYRQLAFKPFSAWMVLADAVSHACLSGQFALVDTFMIPLRNCRLLESAPFYVLQGQARASP
jgi:hypothetical protein